MKIYISAFGNNASAVAAMDQYRMDYMAKMEEFTRKLAYLGRRVIVRIISPHRFNGDTENNLKVEPLIRKRGHAWVLTTTSAGILYLEFGSGVRNIGNQNPKAAEHDMGPGTNSPKGHWNDEGGWFYPTDDDRLIVFRDKNGQGYGHTYGTRPVMPFYNAEKEIMENVVTIAQEVWG